MKNELREIDWKSVHSPGKEDNWLEFALLEKCLKEARERNPDTMVIEVGSYCGFSTCCIAQYYPVLAIDLWGIDNLEIIETQGEMIGRADTWGIFQENMERFQLRDRVFPTCTTSFYLEQLTAIGVNLNVELAFIDACHDAPWPYLDAKRCMPHLSKTGVLAFHDAMRGYVEKYERSVKSVDECKGHGWGYAPFDRMLFDPWAGVAEGIEQILAEGEFQILDKAHGMMVLKQK